MRPSASSCPTSAKPSARTLARIARSSPGSVLPRSVSATSSTKVSKSCRAPVRVSPVSDLGESEALASRAERVDHGQTALERMDEVPAAPLQIVRFSIRNVPSRARTRVPEVAGRLSQTARSTRASSIPSPLNTLPSAAGTCGDRPSVVVAKNLTSVSTREPGKADLLARSPARPRVKPKGRRARPLTARRTGLRHRRGPTGPRQRRARHNRALCVGAPGRRRHLLHPSLARSRAIVRRARSGTPPRRPSSSTVQA